MSLASELQPLLPANDPTTGETLELVSTWEELVTVSAPLRKTLVGPQYESHDALGHVRGRVSDDNVDFYHPYWWPVDDCVGIVWRAADGTISSLMVVYRDPADPTTLRNSQRWGRMLNSNFLQPIWWDLGFRRSAFRVVDATHLRKIHNRSRGIRCRVTSRPNPQFPRSHDVVVDWEERQPHKDYNYDDNPTP